MLTSKLHSGLPADNGSNGVAGYALINASMLAGLWSFDQQVPFHESVVGVHVNCNVLTIELPSGECSEKLYNNSIVITLTCPSSY